MSFELAPMASHNVIGFVGLDQLSLQLASSLLRFGYAVQAFETCSPLLDEFANQGGIRCASPVEVGKDVVALVVLISPADQINDLLFGHESALKGLRKDAVIILHSTILPAHIQKLEKRLTEDLERVFVVDIYVSKGMSEVLNGKIMIISSGQSDAVTRARPILSAMSEKLYVFEGALGARRVFKNHVPQLLRDNQTKHLLNTFVQNLGVVLDMAKSCTFPLPLLAVAFQQLIAGSSHGHGNDGDDTLIKAWEKVYGVNITNAVKAETYSPEELANQITTESKSVNRIGFIGLGAMGFGMATHLLRSNFCVVAYDVYEPMLSRFANEGGLIGSSPAEVSKVC